MGGHLKKGGKEDIFSRKGGQKEDIFFFEINTQEAKIISNLHVNYDTFLIKKFFNTNFFNWPSHICLHAPSMVNRGLISIGSRIWSRGGASKIF